MAGEFAALGHQNVGLLALRFNASDRSRQRFKGFAAPVLIEVDEGVTEPHEPAGMVGYLDLAIKYVQDLAKNDAIMPKQTPFSRVVSGEIPASV